MAKHLARIHGTEEDKVNCPFYFKIGACRHADRCSRIHHRPAFSQTILIKHIYRHPIRDAELKALAEGVNKENIEVDKDKAMEDFLQFFENLYEELGKFGKIEALHICDNLGDHMIGHVYVKFSEEEEASDALNVMNGRYYDGLKMEVEFSPVTDFREARCRDFDEDVCSRGGFCNFMHIKPVPICLIRSLEDDCEEERRIDEAKRLEREQRGRSRRKRRHRERDSRDRRRERKRHRRSNNADSDGERGGSVAVDSDSSRSRSRSPKRRPRSYSRSRSRSRSTSRSRNASRSPNEKSRSRIASRSRSPNEPMTTKSKSRRNRSSSASSTHSKTKQGDNSQK